MKKFYPVALFLSLCAMAHAQALFNNNGADIYVTDGGFMIVKTNSLYNNVSSGAGQINNQGTIVVEGYVKNDASITGSGDTIRLQGDWINNNAYTGSNSWVDMYGGNQLITGTAVTTFDNLNLGGGAVVKKQTIDAVTSGQLQLNDAELATDAYQMLVSNTNTGAITRNNGFVSSVGAGNLARATNSTGIYNFPTGSPSYNNPPSIFRPVDMTPASGGADIYGACLVKDDATNDGYNVNSLDNTLCKVNPNFYHRLYHSNGADATALTMYYSSGADGDWTDEAHWKNSVWNYLGAASTGSGMGMSTVTVNSVSDFNPEPFALARKKFALDAGPDVTITEGQSAQLTPSVGASSGSTITWTPDQDLSCADCEDPVASPTATTRYTIEVTDAGGCSVSDSLLVTVTNSGILIPTAFSPNGDGVNDIFHALNKNIVKIDLQVYNRWGEKVFETDDFTVGWDGTYKNDKQDMGVYVWECSYMLQGDKKTRFAKGNVTLIR
ncbi:MAG TPA: gliding motility-associated C-terminal domain-containing protein [Chitinophagales bacterium]|nr:gliding motility-associated C-terminal domain-containing protein [Chitinophagales bacterium]